MLVVTGAANPTALLDRKAAQKAIFDHVLKGVLGFDDGDLLLKALDGNGLESIADVVSLSDSQIESLTFDSGTGARLLPLAIRNRLRILRSWNFHLRQGGRYVDWMDATIVNEDAWEEYCVAIYIPPIEPPKASTPRPRRSVARALPSVRLTEVPVPVVVPSAPEHCLLNELVGCNESNGFENELIVDGEPMFIAHGEPESDDDVGVSDAPSFEDGRNVFADGKAVVVATVLEVASPIKRSKISASKEFRGPFSVVDCCDEIVTTCPLGDMIVEPVDFGCDDNDLVDCRVYAKVDESNVVFDPGGGDRDVLFYIFRIFSLGSKFKFGIFDLLLLDRGEL